MKKVLSKIFLYFFWGILIGSENNILTAQTNYPTPVKPASHLFYIQRTGNTNTIMYDAVLTSDAQIAITQPIKPYWIRFAENGDKKDLSFIQRKFAYGVEIKKLQTPNEFEFYIVSYSKIKMKLMLDKIGKPIALTHIDGKLSILNKVFINMDPGTLLSFKPDIKYLELFGSNLQTGEPIYEKIIL